MFKVEGKPGVAYLQPEEFRYSPAIKDPNFQAIKLGGGSFLEQELQIILISLLILLSQDQQMFL